MAEAAFVIAIAVELGIVFEAIREIFFRLFHENFLLGVASALGFGATKGDFFANKAAIDVQKALDEEVASMARDGHLESTGWRNGKPHAFRKRVFTHNNLAEFGVVDNHESFLDTLNNHLDSWGGRHGPLELSQDLFELSMIGMFTGKDNWHFGVGWSFKSLNAIIVSDFSFLDRFEFILEAGADCVDVDLNPD